MGEVQKRQGEKTMKAGNQQTAKKRRKRKRGKKGRKEKTQR